MTTTTLPDTKTKAVHLSASQLRTYSTCSLQWHFSRHFEPEFVSAALVFGTAIHAALQAFYQARLEGMTLSAEAMYHVFEETFAAETRPIQYNKTDDEETLKAKAGRMIETFIATVQPGEVIGVEEPFECNLDDTLPPLVGRIDLLEVRTDVDGVKRLHLVDFKTAATKPGHVNDLASDQLVLYALAAYRTGLIRQLHLPLALRYDVLTKTKSPEFISLTAKPGQQEARRVIEKAKHCWNGMTQGLCFPSEGWQCATCGYKKQCSEWPSDTATRSTP